MTYPFQEEPKSTLSRKSQMMEKGGNCCMKLEKRKGRRHSLPKEIRDSALLPWLTPAFGKHSPHVSIPQQHLDGVDDVGLTKLDSDPLPVIVINWVTCEPSVKVVILCISIQQGCFHLPSDHLGAVPCCGNVLLRY